MQFCRYQYDGAYSSDSEGDRDDYWPKMAKNPVDLFPQRYDVTQDLDVSPRNRVLQYVFENGD